MDLHLIVPAFIGERSKLLSGCNRASQTTTHISANRHSARRWGRSAIMGKEADDILNDPYRLTHASSDSMDFDVADVAISILHFLQHLGDSSPDLTIH